jgi:putative transposase
MKYRRSLRLQSYDYTAIGGYFVTVRAKGGKCVFGEVVNNAMCLNGCGKIVEACWAAIPNHFDGVELDVFVVMPNHIHGIVQIIDRAVGAQHAAPPQQSKVPFRSNVKPGSLGAIVRSFKSASARQINGLRNLQEGEVWQRNYYEHVIRDDHSLERIRDYIANNPARWAEDEENSERRTLSKSSAKRWLEPLS